MNSALRELVGKVRADDPYIAGVRVGQNQPRTVRLVIDLKREVVPQQFTLAPVAAYQHRLVFDLYPTEERDPLLALVRDKERAENAAAKAVQDALGDFIGRVERPPALPTKPGIAAPTPSTSTPVPSQTAAPPEPPSLAMQKRIDRLIIVDKIDAPGVNLPALLAQIQATFGKECLPLNLPDAGGTKVVDCFYNREGHSDFGSVDSAHRALVEQVVEVDAAFVDRYLNDAALTDPAWFRYDDVIKAWRDANSVDGKPYGIPYDGEVTVQVYRKDLYAAKGLKPATTYEQTYTTTTTVITHSTSY
jgi:hypothetical protein